MPASDRVVYGRAFKVTPVWMWLAQRLSGLLLGPLVLLHMVSDKTAGSSVLNAVLLAVILVHGYSGLRRVAVKRDRYGLTLGLTVLWCAVVAFFGVLLVLFHQPSMR
jgi:succinate dehydrogenase hydrophobic anchor subunit